jgi:glutamine synthetase
LDTAFAIEPAHAELADRLRAEGVRYVFGSFIDVLGRAKSKCVPIDHLPALLAGHERYTPRGLGDLGVMTPDEDECVALPDPAGLRVLPWDRRFAWMPADLLFGGTEPFALCTRSILKRQLERAAGAGLTFNVGCETEIYVVSQAAVGEPDGYLTPGFRTASIKPTQAYDVEATLDAMGFLDPMVTAMNATGFDVFSFDAEGGDGQYEFDFEYRDALAMCDQLTLFRLMVKQVAKQSGLFATFMPKPYTGAWGSGAHFNMSLEDTDGTNLFRQGGDDRGWSKMAYSFVAGILRHAPALAAICTPTVNSYKRLAPRLADGTVSWAPVWAAYGDNNRSCMLRLPRNRPAVENRAVDSAANPYLAAAFLLAAGLEGMAEKLDPGGPVEDLTYDWARTGPEGGDVAATRLPRTLLEAIEAFEADPLTRDVFPERFVTEYVAMKVGEWDEYHAQVTDWERATYLERF